MTDPTVLATLGLCCVCRVKPVSRHDARTCSRACGAVLSSATRHVPPEERFWAKVDRSGGREACWPWRASRKAKGYGSFRLNGVVVQASRAAYEFTHGPLPAGMQALHRCDNPPCCNPDHLFPGTNADNVQDKVFKGRQAGGAKTAILGERHGMAKLTAEDVREIRRMVAAGALQREAAARFGIRDNTVSKIVARKSWGHVA